MKKNGKPFTLLAMAISYSCLFLWDYIYINHTSIKHVLRSGFIWLNIQSPMLTCPLVFQRIIFTQAIQFMKMENQ